MCSEPISRLFRDVLKLHWHADFHFPESARCGKRRTTGQSRENDRHNLERKIVKKDPPASSHGTFTVVPQKLASELSPVSRNENCHPSGHGSGPQNLRRPHRCADTLRRSRSDSHGNYRAPYFYRPAQADARPGSSGNDLRPLGRRSPPSRLMPIACAGLAGTQLRGEDRSMDKAAESMLRQSMCGPSFQR